MRPASVSDREAVDLAELSPFSKLAFVVGVAARTGSCPCRRPADV